MSSCSKWKEHEARTGVLLRELSQGNCSDGIRSWTSVQSSLLFTSIDTVPRRKSLVVLLTYFSYSEDRAPSLGNSILVSLVNIVEESRLDGFRVGACQKGDIG